MAPGLSGSRGGAGKAAALAATKTATQRVYDGVYLAIVEHRLRPGARLREEELADSYGVSRTLVRQALQRLAADQVVDLQHNRGAQVPQPGPASLRTASIRRCVTPSLVLGLMTSSVIASLP